MSRRVGIIGGMGPLACADLFTKIIQATPAKVDQEHLRIIVDNNPHIPPRVEALLGQGESPLPAMQASARLLENAGAELIVIACNTAHYWFRDIQAAIGVPMISMIAAAAEYVSARCCKESGKLLLLARDVTVRTALFQEAFAGSPVELVIPGESEQALVEQLVMGVKAGAVADNPALEGFRGMLQRYRLDGVTAVLAGCTEIPLMFPYFDEGMQKYDATMIVAEKVVREAMAP